MKTCILVCSLLLSMVSMPSIASVASDRSDEDDHKSMEAHQKAQAADVDAFIPYRKENGIRELVSAGVLAVLFIFFLIPTIRIMRTAKNHNEEVLANAIQIREAVEDIRGMLRERKSGHRAKPTSPNRDDLAQGSSVPFVAVEDEEHDFAIKAAESGRL